MLLAPRLQLDDPLVEILAADAEGVLLALVRASSESVHRNGYMEPELAHRNLPAFGGLRTATPGVVHLYRPCSRSELIARPASTISVRDSPEMLTTVGGTTLVPGVA
jgi:hypothetical protein